MRLSPILFLLLAALAGACSSTSSDSADLTADQSVTEVSMDAQVQPDETEPLEEVAIDLATPDLTIDPLDDTFRVGLAQLETPCPLGMPTAGYGQSLDKDKPHSPFTSSFIAAMTQHTPILAKALYFRRGEQEMVIIRIDKIGTTAQLLDEANRRLDKMTGREWDGKIFLASNHTHLGPGRLWEADLGEFANYLFWPYYYGLYAQSIANVAVEAIQNAEPARFGYGKTECPECHNDRRCQNPDLKDSTMWVLKFEDEAGELLAVVLNFAIHGTVFGYMDSVLSGDAPGMMEHKLQETFDHPVPVFMIQSWGGDVSPADPEVEQLSPTNEHIPGDYNRLERIGYAASLHVQDVLPTIETEADVDFESITIRHPFHDDIMNYEEGEWPYDFGGMMCGTNQDAPCWGEDGEEPFMYACLPLPPESEQDQITLSAGRIGDLVFVTLPGEPHTDWTLEILAEITAKTGYETVLGFGYTNDHWGYLMNDWDWLRGGYEPTVTAWGPQQGEYLAELVVHTARKMLDPQHQLPQEEVGLRPPEDLSGSVYKIIGSEVVAGFESQPDASIPETGAAVVSWHGGDTWYGTPMVTLQKKSGDDWETVMTHDGLPWDNRTYLMATSYFMSPTWNEEKKAEFRDFLFTVTMPIRRNVPTPNKLELAVPYRFHIVGTIKWEGKKESYQLTSEEFVVD
jgi:neutral ceramidase